MPADRRSELAMLPILYAHPVSSYCKKVLTALYENGTAFDYRTLENDTISLADCGAAPFLFFADWSHPIGDAFPNVIAYRKRLLARPSFARAVDEAHPYRHYFPLGAPDRD